MVVAAILVVIFGILLATANHGIWTTPRVIIATVVVVIAIVGLTEYLAMPETTDASELQSSGKDSS